MQGSAGLEGVDVVMEGLRRHFAGIHGLGPPSSLPGDPARGYRVVFLMSYVYVYFVFPQARLGGKMHIEAHPHLQAVLASLRELPHQCTYARGGKVGKNMGFSAALSSKTSE